MFGGVAFLRKGLEKTRSGLLGLFSVRRKIDDDLIATTDRIVREIEKLIAAGYVPGGYEEFSALVVPELQRRGLPPGPIYQRILRRLRHEDRKRAHEKRGDQKRHRKPCLGEGHRGVR